ncbi:MAG: sensor histidine kinase [Sandaracinaceae bacterium]
MRSVLAQLAAVQLISLLGLLLVHAVLSAALAPTGHRETRALRRVRPVLQAAFQGADRERDEALVSALARTSRQTVELLRSDPQGRSTSLAQQGSGQCEVWDVTPLDEGRELRICSEGFPFRGGRFRVTVFVLAGLLAAGLALGLARSVTAPLSRLSEAAHALEFNVEHPLPPPEGPSEVRSLRASMASMVGAVRSRMATQRDLLSLASHELRSPLARMQVWLGLAQEGIDPAAHLAAVEREIEALAGLVEDVLATSRLETGSLQLRAVGVAATVRAIDEAVTVVGDAEVLADPTLFTRVLGVLIDNAKRYGQPPVEVRVSEEAPDGRGVQVCVVDHGGGFGSPARTGGAGVGLALAERICAAHGATLEVRSARGEDTVIALRWQTSPA